MLYCNYIVILYIYNADIITYYGIYIYIHTYVCFKIRDNVTYEGFRVLDFSNQSTNIKRSCDTLAQ